MPHYRQWSAAFASYFTILGLWTAFGPSTLMAAAPAAAPAALAAITLAYFVATPFVRALWVRFGFGRTAVLMGGGVAASLLAAALAPTWLAWCVPLAFFFGSASYTLCETRLLEDLARAGQGHAFGRARKWGSFGFLAAASLGGAVFALGSVGSAFTALLALCALVYFGCCVALARVEHEPAPEAGPVAGHGAQIAADPAPGTDHGASQRSDGAHQARQARPGPAPDRPVERWGGAAAITGMRLAEAVSTTWFGAYWLHTGHGPLETGLLCALPVAAEFLAMWKGGAFLQRHSASAMMALCTGVSALRWAATPWCEALWCAVPLQSAHAFTFGFFYPASLIWLKQAFHDDFFRARYATEALARALTAAVSYLAAGWLIAAHGYGALYALGTALALPCGL